MDLFILMLHCGFVYLSDQRTKRKISQDIQVYLKQSGILPMYYNHSNGIISYKYLRRVLRKYPEYRNVFYTRIAHLTKRYHMGRILQLILKPYPFLYMGTPADKIGGGLFIQHGNSTIVHAESIGDYCWVNQNVTIGDSGKGIPTIGNHVKIHTGAVVLGPIEIGDYAVIGANATIVKSVPPHCTVVPSPSYIVRRNGIRVNENL